MLSSENPPPDLPCSCEISQQLKSSDETNQHQLDDEIDLFKSGLDDNNIYPLPNFSIRNYVFSTRHKDIKNNWPFSQENLQLCRKYGVNDVLPPFQSPDSVRNPSTPKSASENLSYSDDKLSACQKLAVDIVENINSSEFPSTTRIKSVRSLESPTKTPEFTVKASKKVEIIRNTVKKCRLIVKPKNISEQKSNQDLVSNTSLVSETMASKVCPVCKTFSSSSNTTLNAHIDQCLSGESNIKWTENSKQVIKHRMKPRKTRLMVDIYETALHCTLEDLDRRNGTNWASNWGFQADQDSEAYAVEKNKPCSSANIEDVNEDDDVYVDSNWTKLRSLSKLGDVPLSSNASYDCGLGKFVKKDKGNIFLSSKKKRCLLQKEKLLDHYIYGQGSDSSGPDCVLKCSPYGQKSCDFEPDRCPGPEVKKGQQNKPEVCDDVTQSHINYDQMKPDDLGMLKQWVGSKRTGLRGKMNLEHGSDHHPDKRKKNSRIKSCMSYIADDMLVKRNSVSKFHISYNENPLSPTESLKRKKNLLCNNPRDECIEQRPCSRKRPGISLLKDHDCHDRNNRLEFSKFSVENLISLRNDKKIVCPSVNNDSSFVSSRMSQHHTFSSEGKESSFPGKKSAVHVTPSGSKKYLFMGKKLLPVKHAFGPESNTKLREKHSNLKKHRLGENEAQIHRQDTPLGTLGENEARVEKKDSSKSSINRTRVLKFQKRREAFMNAGKGDVNLKGIETSPKSDNHGSVGKNIVSFTGGNVEIQDEFVCEPCYEIADGKAFGFVSQHYGELKTFCADEVEDMDTGEAPKNYYVDVDPIPIPGPPGSFLPSPGRMGSEELQGNSSLTTCKIQSSEDERDFFGLDSSDSPISAISVVSNSFAPRSEPPSIVNLPMPSPVRQKFPEKKPTPEFQKNASNSTMGYAPALVSNNSEAMFTACRGYCESPTPSASNPVFRLMGKNLMVVNKDENWSSQTKFNTQSSMTIENHPCPWSCVDNGISTSNDIHKEPHSFSRILSGGSSVLENLQTSMPAQHFDCNFLDFRPLQMSAHPSTVMLPSKSAMSHEYASKQKDIIVIDDSPEISEAGLAIRATDSGVNPFYGNQTLGYYPLCAGSPIFPSGNYTQVPFSKGTNAYKWINCTAVGSNVVSPNSLTASLPSVVRHRSSLYCSPGFS